MSTDESLKKKLDDVFSWIIDEEAYGKVELDRRRAEFIFHMTDCIAELTPFVDSMNSEVDSDESARRLYQFFTHALNHLNAARDVVLPDYQSPF